MRNDFLWTEVYRPRTVAETILPEANKRAFQQFVDQGNVPNLLLTGPGGVGKTTVARAMLEELGCDYIVINGSLNGNIDTLRNEIQNFASSVSFTGGRKYIILDEADYLTTATQPALRNFMEEFSSNASFILTCNYPKKIIPELHSRCSVVEFRVSKKDAPKLALQFYNRVLSILDKEGVEYEAQAVAALVQKHFPDFRRVVNELQRYSAVGKIDSGILADVKDVSIHDLVELVRSDDYTGVRKWVVDNLDLNESDIFRRLYDTSLEYVKPKYIPALVMLIGKYQYQAAFVVDQEVNLMAFFAEVMVEGVYK
jgi:DNA polymerase III delta prime subunit